ncbi:MAG: cyanophycin synthetase, partial [Streptosporangiaceae bacterium]
EGLEFGVVGRELAVGGQQVSVRGLLGDYPDLYLPLFGEHQAGNLACAIAAVEAFAGTPGARAGADAAGLDLDIVRRAVASMTSPGRLEVVRRSPVVIVDGAHNPGGMAATVEALTEAFSFTDLVAVVSVFADKDVPGILGELEPAVSHLIATTNSSARALPARQLAEIAATVLGPDRVTVAERLDDAIELGVALADEADALAGGPGQAGVLITGAIVTAGEARVLLVEGNAGTSGEAVSARPGAGEDWS